MQLDQFLPQPNAYTVPQVKMDAVLQCVVCAETEIQALQHRCSRLWTKFIKGLRDMIELCMTVNDAALF